MIEILWGLKTTAIFDVWTIEHLLSGISVGSVVKKRNLKELNRYFSVVGKAIRSGEYRKLKKILPGHHSFHFDVVGVLFAAYVWETIEHYLETGLAGDSVMNWFQGVEFWPNRIIADPLMLVFGYLIAKRYPKLVIPARFFSISWLLIHIFVFPDSMYLHTFI
jgi:hypothetical protein